MPVVVVSSLTPQGSAKALEALAAGAVEVLAQAPAETKTLKGIWRSDLPDMSGRRRRVRRGTFDPAAAAAPVPARPMLAGNSPPVASL